MNLYLCSQDENDGYDTHDSFVCVAESSSEAMNVYPCEYESWGGICSTWCKSPDLVTVQYIGEAYKGMKKGVVCASFNSS